MRGVRKITKLTAIMRWVEANQQWFMYNASDNKFIMNFFDCRNISRIFPGMKKDKENKYEMVIRSLQ